MWKKSVWQMGFVLRDAVLVAVSKSPDDDEESGPISDNLYNRTKLCLSVYWGSMGDSSDFAPLVSSEPSSSWAHSSIRRTLVHFKTGISAR